MRANRATLSWGALLTGIAALPAQADLPAGPGRAETERLCQGCHDISQSVSLRQDRNGWSATLVKMVGFGVKASDEELGAMVEYLAKHYPAGELPPLDVNEARAIQLESRLSLKRSEAAAILRHRDEHGPFKSLKDLLAVPGIDTAKIESKQGRLVFRIRAGN